MERVLSAPVCWWCWLQSRPEELTLNEFVALHTALTLQKEAHAADLLEELAVDKDNFQIVD